MFNVIFCYFSVQTSVTFHFITTMKVLLERVVVVEEGENAYINFHSRLIISALIVCMVSEVRGCEKGKEGRNAICVHIY